MQTVGELMEKIRLIKDTSETLFNMTKVTKDEHMCDLLTDASAMLDDYIEVLKSLKVPGT